MLRESYSKEFFIWMVTQQDITDWKVRTNSQNSVIYSGSERVKMNVTYKSHVTDLKIYWVVETLCATVY